VTLAHENRTPLRHQHPGHRRQPVFLHQEPLNLWRPRTARAASPQGPTTSLITRGPEATGDEAQCCICFDAVSALRITLNECNHELCLECYSQAVVRTDGDSLCCPICRVASSVSTTTEQARNVYGQEEVSRAFDAARILRNTVLSNSRDALRTREHQPQLFCDVCHGVIDQHALVRMLCGCQFHRRCALGHVEDHLQQALDTRSDRITCAQPVQHANTYDPTISAFLHQVTQLGQSEGEEAERSIASQVPAPPPSASPPDSPDPSPRANSPEWIPRPRLFPTGVVICSFCHQSGGPCSAMIQTACSCWVHRTCALTFVENNLSAGFSNGEGMVTCPNPATHEVAQPLFLPRLFDQVRYNHLGHSQRRTTDVSPTVGFRLNGKRRTNRCTRT